MMLRTRKNPGEASLRSFDHTINKKRKTKMIPQLQSSMGRHDGSKADAFQEVAPCCRDVELEGNSEVRSPVSCCARSRNPDAVWSGSVHEWLDQQQRQAPN